MYKSIVWDREYFLNIAATISFKVEIANYSYYTLSSTFTLAKVGFGIQDILFEQSPTQFCNLYYIDSRFLEASLTLESNSKPCGYNFIDHMSYHYDSYPTEDQGDQETQIETK